MRSIVLLLILAAWAPSYARQTATAVSLGAAFETERFYRSELYMGRSIPNGGAVSDAEWEQFLTEVVTPRFPEGFTVLSARGQWRESSGAIAKEPSEVLVFLYKKVDRRAADRKIDEIRREYIRRFRQESVMRVDLRKSVIVAL